MLRPRAVSEGVITAIVVLLLVIASTILSLRLTAPQLSWDEADYALAAEKDWHTLRNAAPHAHGALMLYFVKLGSEAPLGLTSIEDRSRLFLALLGSLAVGVAYLGLRHAFTTSRLSAFAGANLLMLSVIRLRETNIIGPHYPFLLWTLLVCVLGYRWWNTPTISAALSLGTVFGLAASTSVHVIPLAIGWTVAMVVMRAKWLEYDRMHLRIPWTSLLLLGTAIVVASLIWPRTILPSGLLGSLRYYLENAGVDHSVLVKQEFLKKPPVTTYLYWLWHLDSPILVFGLLGLAGSAYQAFRTRSLTSEQRLLLSFLGVLCATAVAHQITGARYLLLVIGIVCLFAASTCDKFVRRRPLRKIVFACLVIGGPIFNLVSVQMHKEDISPFFWNGYRRFFEQNRARLSERSVAYIEGVEMFSYYAVHSGVPVKWELSPLSWRAWEPVPPNARYALIAEDDYRYLPLEHPARRVVDRNWNVIWSFKEPGSWGLRLYERP